MFLTFFLKHAFDLKIVKSRLLKSIGIQTTGGGLNSSTGENMKKHKHKYKVGLFYCKGCPVCHGNNGYIYKCEKVEKL